LPVIIADGEFGDEFTEVQIDGKHLTSCKLGKAFADYEQVLVLSHFKGHRLAGFGGAIKNLAMGFASKGGKLAMHMDVKPRIVDRKCRRCHVCESHCAFGALHIAKDDSEKSYIDQAKCSCCAACSAACPHKAISIFSFRSLLRMIGFGNPFHEKLAEYALAASKGKKHIYINFLMNITAGCDCEGHSMKPLTEDIGILASTDPVAIDQACLDLLQKKGKRFRGIHALEHAEMIGAGTRQYKLVTI
jgi:uncharacterized protein